MQQQGGNPAMAGGIILLVAGVLILAGTVTKKWFGESNGDFSYGMGLTGIEMCGGGHCESKSWTDKEMKDSVKKDIIAWGYGGFLGGLASGIVCFVAGGMALARKKFPKVIGIILFSGTALMWLLFVGRVLSEGRGPKPDPSYSGGLAFVGLILGFVAMLAMLGEKKAMVPMQPMPMQGGQPGPCPRCNSPVTFVAQYGRWFCQRCQQYV
jgi:hypothetical protein